MSKEAIVWANSVTGLVIAQKSILKELAVLYNAEKGYAWPGKAALEQRTGVSKRHISRVTKALEERGLVWVQHCFFHYDNPHPRQINNRYYLPQFDPESTDEAKMAGKAVIVTPSPNYETKTIQFLRDDEW